MSARQRQEEAAPIKVSVSVEGRLYEVEITRRELEIQVRGFLADRDARTGAPLSAVHTQIGVTLRKVQS